MERNHFKPQAESFGEGLLRDLPPAEYTPMPRMERVPDGEGGCGCPGSDTCHEGCPTGSFGLCEYPLAMVYAPCQYYRALYDPQTALSRGTLFTELDLPLGKEGCAFTTDGCACRMERRRV